MQETVIKELALARQWDKYDASTSLSNLSSIRERIDCALHRSRRTKSSVILLHIDIDGIQLVSETHGQEIGNLLLETIVCRLHGEIRKGESAVRLSDREYLILCEQAGQAATMAILAQRINDTLCQPVFIAGLTLSVTASVGIAIDSDGAQTAIDMLRHADAAMKVAKEQGHSNWQFFSEQVQEQAQQRMRIASALSTALARNEFSPHFQPIVVADSGRIVGAELLLRWNPPQGPISPAVFIPIAEMTGAIIEIGSWVFMQACRAEVDWRGRWGEQAPYVSVNVSTRQLNDEALVDVFALALRITGADPARLLLEITETALMADIEKNLLILRGLADLGLRVAIDDFGTGYSSLAQLTRLPVNVLKIDKALIDDIDKNPESRAVIRAVIGLGHTLGLKLVAEGVETMDQQIELCAQGCDFIQGYRFHRPLPEALFVDAVAREIRDGASVAAAPLEFLIYVSTATAPMPGLALDAILKQSSSYNRTNGITGCLLYQDGYFMQMLEGKQEVLEGLMEKIKSDSRHSDVLTVIEGRAPRRIFIDWSMDFRDLMQGGNKSDFQQWQKRTISFVELAEDAHTCYMYITSHMRKIAVA
ncbi:EAL domain-containing protein [Glaciimonas sp. GNP009]